MLQVTLPTNFKVARFDVQQGNHILRRLEGEIDAIRFDVSGESIELPVKLRFHDSIFVPLAKWAMLTRFSAPSSTSDMRRKRSLSPGKAFFTSSKCCALMS